jgi:hypothetical protein
VLGPDGLSRFEELRRRTAAHAAILYAFDLIEHDGKDLRNLPFLDRKAALARLLRNAKAGILLNEHIADQERRLTRRHLVQALFVLGRSFTLTSRHSPPQLLTNSRACTHKIASGENRLVSIGPLQNSLFRGNVRLQLSISRPTQ